MIRMQMSVRRTAGSLVVLLVAVAISLCSAVPAFAASATPAKSASGGFSQRYVQTATKSNTTGAFTFIDYVTDNNNPNALLFVTETDGTFDNAHVGVTYVSFLGKWAIFNENLTSMPIGAQFNVVSVTSPVAGVYTVAASKSNISGDELFLNDPMVNNNPSAAFMITPQWQLFDFHSIDSHAIGVRYNSTTGQWALYHEDRSPFHVGAVYNVFFSPFLQSQYIATVNNLGQACVTPGWVDSSTFMPVLTHVFNGQRIPSVLTVTYNATTTQWCIVDHRGTLPANEIFLMD